MVPAQVISRIATLGLSEDQATVVSELLFEVERATTTAVTGPLEKKLGIKRAKDAEVKRRIRSNVVKRLENIEAALVPSQRAEVA